MNIENFGISSRIKILPDPWIPETQQNCIKKATRRNCLTEYKHQNPAGGRFMCTYCGHVSQTPLLDISNVVIHGNSDGSAASGANLFVVIDSICEWCKRYSLYKKKYM